VSADSQYATRSERANSRKFPKSRIAASIHMKRCPQCNRLEPDDTLAFCRVDGSSLLAVTSEELGTIRLNSGPHVDEGRTTILPSEHTSDALPKITGTTTSSTPSQPITRELKKPKKLRLVVLVLVVLIVAAAGVSAFFLTSKKNRPPIQSIAVMP